MNIYPMISGKYTRKNTIAVFKFSFIEYFIKNTIEINVYATKGTTVKTYNKIGLLNNIATRPINIEITVK